MSYSPEGLVTQRFQPNHHIFNCFKVLHGTIVSDFDPITQISGGKA
jgi:hypothetical protein